ncbi:aldehyde dehydrogenase family protein [Holdemania massiliensis]|uniref:aldehyde dehydrogenase family protein n=1 Tax=Holdemania massiliensis TaxID=1468449 RepID=UPI001F05D58D|nr:aldehyde dehydrogenase family protein [Holdemania massiliensis]MCH1941965.1 aldehyde dehydrogenase family protein [Holdemania massiliensis]
MWKVNNQIGSEALHNPASVHPITSPLNGQVIGEVSYADSAMIDKAVAKARTAQKQWAQLTYKKRTEVLFAMRQQLLDHEAELAQIITQENGKSLAESQAAVAKAVELCEFAVSIPAVIAGRTELVSSGIEVKEMTFPVGVLACITPFNFPLMVPMWTIPNALVCGNAVILKPSEATPITAMKIAELFAKAGLPDGLLSVVNGEKEVVEALCDHPDIDALTFVGSTPVAKLVYKRATASLKRCLAMGGAKNHILVTEEVDPQIVAKEITSAAYGMSGQRCMAASVVLAIGHCDAVIDQIITLSKEMVAGRDCPPLISQKAVDKVCQYLEKTPGSLVVDGRKAQIEGDPNGYYIGPSVILYDDIELMPEEEVFGPTLEIIKAATLEEAIVYQNCSPYGNGASIFTDTGLYAQKAVLGLSSGMLGVNIGVPVPRDPFSFGGLKGSKFGYGDITGYGSLSFLTTTRKVTTKWNPKDKKDWLS